VNAGEGDLLDSLRGGNEIPRARCCRGVTHAGDKVERGRIERKNYFQLVLRLVERSFEWGGIAYAARMGESHCMNSKA
jgi:hypothetical protein